MTDAEKHYLFLTCGARPIMQGDNSFSYNFGLCHSGGFAKSINDLQKFTGPGVHEVAPSVGGKWDRKTSISGWGATHKVLGKFLPAQHQKIGSCGGAATSGGLNVLQCLQICAGKDMEFKPISRAYVYVGARILTGMRGRSEGVIPPSPLEWCQQKGAVNLEETGEAYDSDHLASEWDRRGIPDAMIREGADNLIQEMAPCYSFDEAADVIASGGVVMVASDMGFSMRRDRYGVCRPEGKWMHYMYFASVHKIPDGREVLGCGQSWGQNVPDGPLLEGCPDYVFGVEKSVADDMLGQRTSTAVHAFAGWSMPFVPWIFV